VPTTYLTPQRMWRQSTLCCAFCRALWQRLCRVLRRPSPKKRNIVLIQNEKTQKIRIFLMGRLSLESSIEVAAFFTRKSRALQLRELSLYSFKFLTFCTNLSVNWSFDNLNGFKGKTCQLQSFIPFKDLQLSFRKFLHPRFFQNSNCNFRN
jgi:hypothetical protein